MISAQIKSPLAGEQFNSGVLTHCIKILVTVVGLLLFPAETENIIYENLICNMMEIFVI